MQTNTTVAYLTSQDDLGRGNDNQNETQHVEQIPDGACASWMASDDATVRCVAGGLHQPSLERVVDPLPNADKHDPQAEQQRMCVGDTTHVDGKAGSCTRCAKCPKRWYQCSTLSQVFVLSPINTLL